MDGRELGTGPTVDGPEVVPPDLPPLPPPLDAEVPTVG